MDNEVERQISKRNFGCYQFPNLNHCPSCHEDVDYGYDLCTFYKDDIEVSCCCSSLSDLEEMPEEDFYNHIKEIEKIHKLAEASNE